MLQSKVNTDGYPSEPQLEILLSGEACDLYQNLTGHTPNLTDCKFLSEHELAFVFEDVITPIEQAFLAQGLQSLTIKIRKNIDDIFHYQLKDIVYQYTNQVVVDTLSKSKIETARKGIIFILDADNDENESMEDVSVIFANLGIDSHLDS